MTIVKVGLGRECTAHAVTIHFMWYNVVKIHTTLKVTPAMVAGVTQNGGKT